MKTNKIFIALVIVPVFLIVSCSNGIINEGSKIVVETRVGEADQYELFREISDRQEVQNAKDILEKASWENAEVSMVRPTDYKFHFEDSKEELNSNGLIYELWISPNKDKVELVIEGEGKYVQLSKEKSGKLFEIIIGKKLTEMS